LEFINGKKRYCLWMVSADPSEIKKCPLVIKKIESVRRFRAESRAASTRQFAETPTLFCQIAQPDGDFIAVPRVSSERRRYVPMGFLTADIIASDSMLLIPGTEPFHFGILTSSLHNSWLRAVGGRLKSDYRYSKDIVYNNFVWPVVTEKQRQSVSQTAKDILKIRSNFPNSSLADLYDPLTMPPELLKAHQRNDKAVFEAYGLESIRSSDESVWVAELMKRYLEAELRASG
jgi:hypothetical protein